MKSSVGPLAPSTLGWSGVELDEVARDESSRQSALPQGGHQQPGRVTAGADSLREGLVGSLDARFHPDRVGDVAIDGGVQRAEKLDRRLPVGWRRGAGCNPFVEERAERGGGNIQVWLEVGCELGRIAEGIGLGVALDEEVERVDHPHVGHQSDGDVQLAGLAREDHSRQVVAEGILLPVDEVVGRRDRQRVGLDGGPGVRRWTQPDDVRPDRDRPVEPVGRAVLERDLHRYCRAPRFLA